MAQENGKDYYFEDKDKILVRLGKGQRTEVNKALVLYSGLYKSRNHFIRCAINRELRRIENSKLEIETNEK